MLGEAFSIPVSVSNNGFTGDNEHFSLVVIPLRILASRLTSNGRGIGGGRVWVVAHLHRSPPTIINDSLNILEKRTDPWCLTVKSWKAVEDAGKSKIGHPKPAQSVLPLLVADKKSLKCFVFCWFKMVKDVNEEMK
ncbi:Hypothetical predicted protein [Olea europaea subsp. europaea]|uniref:Uncharacterized protein n=1 Tax=Olea europaea subsp. europaea TaxID=158383 RepID=A0A8S0TT64_OLEEU|nr:Hypothetical predicted protein [Olea europaea subsp. europaea]